jgi:peptide/nickel transport system ATP-binding protein/oligopeptide transport system ATP-binding protein
MKPSVPEKILQVNGLKTYFFTFDGVARAVDDVSFHLDRGEVLGIVGESGCGKSVMAQSIMRLIPEPPGRIVDGRILFDGVDIATLSMDSVRGIRGNRIAMIFQEPMTSLNPVFTIGNQIAEMFIQHEGLSRQAARDRSVEMLKRVQIPAPERRVQTYPHQLSGGMRQRVMIAMALACNPEILIADEPTTALDVTVQAQILDLMLTLRQDYDTAIMIITHDLGVISEIASRVVVMYAGRVVEAARTVDIFKNPKHPYTRGLLQSIPKLGERARNGRRRLREIAGMVPSLYSLPEGCHFYPRCPDRMEKCGEHLPEILDTGGSHAVRCWLHVLS